jgi:hypothetical protein
VSEDRDKLKNKIDGDESVADDQDLPPAYEAPSPPSSVAAKTVTKSTEAYSKAPSKPIVGCPSPPTPLVKAPIPEEAPPKPLPKRKPLPQPPPKKEPAKKTYWVKFQVKEVKPWPVLAAEKEKDVEGVNIKLNIPGKPKADLGNSEGTTKQDEPVGFFNIPEQGTCEIIGMTHASETWDVIKVE